MLTKFGIVGRRREIGILGSWVLSLLGMLAISVGLILVFGKGPVSPAGFFFSIGFVAIFGFNAYSSLLGKGLAAVMSFGWLIIVGYILISYVSSLVSEVTNLSILHVVSIDFWGMVLLVGFCLAEALFLYLASSNRPTGKLSFD